MLTRDLVINDDSGIDSSITEYLVNINLSHTLMKSTDFSYDQKSETCEKKLVLGMLFGLMLSPETLVAQDLETRQQHASK